MVLAPNVMNMCNTLSRIYNKHLLDVYEIANICLFKQKYNRVTQSDQKPGSKPFNKIIIYCKKKRLLLQYLRL